MQNATHQALRDVGSVAGSAAALQRSLQMVVGAAAGALFGMVSTGSLMAMSGTMLAFAAVSVAIWFAGEPISLLRPWPLVRKHGKDIRNLIDRSYSVAAFGR